MLKRQKYLFLWLNLILPKAITNIIGIAFMCALVNVAETES